MHIESFLTSLKKAYYKEHGKPLFYQVDVPLGTYSAMQCGGVAAACVFPETCGELAFIHGAVVREKYPYFILGKGSNTLFLSGRHEELFILTERLNAIAFTDSTVYAEAGAPLSRLAYQAAERGFAGLSPLFGIPGSVGGAVFMNAGAFGASVADTLYAVDALFSASPDTVTSISVAEGKFAYRKSVFSGNAGGCIAGAEFHLTASSPAEERALMRSVMERRRASQPLSYPSLGSIFRRVGDVSAGFYIEKAGLKGLSVGGAAISQKHAGFIINTGSATPEDVLALMEETEELVFRRLGVTLKSEIQIMR